MKTQKSYRGMIIDRLSTRVRLTKKYSTEQKAHAAAEKLAKKHYPGSLAERCRIDTIIMDNW